MAFDHLTRQRGNRPSVCALLLTVLICTSLATGCNRRGDPKTSQPAEQPATHHQIENAKTGPTAKTRAATDTAKPSQPARQQNNTPDTAPKKTPMAPAQGNSGKPARAKDLPVMETVQVTRPKVEPHPESYRFNEFQLVKDHTVCVLAFDSVTRHTYFLSHFRHLMTDAQQIDKARDFIDSFDHEFTRLRKQREEIMNNASDDQDMEMLLKNNAVETLLVSRIVRRGIVRTVLNREQRAAHMAEVENRREQNQISADRKKQQESPEQK